MTKRFTLQKSERLKSRKSIEFLFKHGNSLSKFPYKVVYTISYSIDTETSLQAGFSASSRNFKKAVDRNRIKRQMREAYRLNNLHLKEYLASSDKKMEIFFIYTGKTLPEYELLFTKMQWALTTLFNKVHDETTT